MEEWPLPNQSPNAEAAARAAVLMYGLLIEWLETFDSEISEIDSNTIRASMKALNEPMKLTGSLAQRPILSDYP